MRHLKSHRQYTCRSLRTPGYVLNIFKWWTTYLMWTIWDEKDLKVGQSRRSFSGIANLPVLLFNCNFVVFARSWKTIIMKVTYQQVLSAWTCWQTQWGLLSLCRKYFSIYKAAKLSGIAINGKSDDLIGWMGRIRWRGRFSRNSLCAEYSRCTLRVMH